MRQTWRWGRWIKWSTAASDNGIGEVSSVSDGPQRKTTEESDSLKSSQDTMRYCVDTSRRWRVGPGIAEIVEIIAGRISWGISEFIHADDIWMETFSRYGEKNRST